jgi:hypothetical protein
MSKAYIIEVRNRTAGIVTGDERGFHFFSSERAFDSLEGREFRSVRDAECAARALLDTGRPAASETIFANALRPARYSGRAN